MGLTAYQHRAIKTPSVLQRLLLNRVSILGFLILLPVHVGLAYLSGLFAFGDGTAAIWPSPGIFLAALLVLGQRLWLPIFFAELIVDQFLFYDHWLLSGAIATLMTAEVVLTSLLLQRFVRSSYPFERISSTLKYLLLLLPVPLVTSALCILTQCFFAVSSWADFKLLYQSWYCSEITATVVITSTLLAIFQLVKAGRWRFSRYRAVELISIFLLLIGIGIAAFHNSAPVQYFVLLPLLWAAMRFSPTEAILLTFIMSVLAIAETLQGYGSFAQAEVTAAVMLLQSFVVFLTVTVLLLAAAIQENRHANRSLKRINAELEDRVTERTQDLSDALKQLQKAQGQLVQQEKMSSLGQMVAGIAHEINNPVSFIHGNLRHVHSYVQDLITFLQLYETHYPNPSAEITQEAEALEIDFIKADLQKTLASMKVGTDRIKEIVLSLRNFSRMDEAEYKLVSLQDGLESTLLILQHRLRAQPHRPEIQVIKHYDSLPLVECYAGQMNQVFMNILVNSIDALESQCQQAVEGSASLQITLRTEARPDSVVIRIADSGPGIPENIKHRIFDPFFTTKPVGKGTGMGMAISYQIVTEKH